MKDCLLTTCNSIAVGDGDGFLYLSREHPSLWLTTGSNFTTSRNPAAELTSEPEATAGTSDTAEQQKLKGGQRERMDQGNFVQPFSFASVDFRTGAGQSAERFLHKPTAAAAAAAAARQAARQKDRPSKYADQAHRTKKQKKQKKKSKHRHDHSREQVDKRVDLWPMDFLHTYLLGERPVVVTDAAPATDVQSLLRETSHPHHNHSLLGTGLTVPYFLDTDAMAVGTANAGVHATQSSNPNLFLANGSAVLLEEGAPRRAIACGSVLLIAVEQAALAAVKIDVMLRPPPLSAMECLSLTRYRSENRSKTLSEPEFFEARAEQATTLMETVVAEGRWNDTSCIHFGKAR